MYKYIIKHISIITMTIAVLLLCTACTTKERSEEEFAKINALRESGIDAYSAGSYEEAGRLFSQAIDACGNLKDAIYVDCYQYYATCLYEQGAYKEAIDAFETVEKSAQNSALADVYYLEGCCYIALDDENSAAIEFEASLKTEDGDYARYCEMYQAFLEAGYVERAESYLKRVISAEDSSDILVGKTYYNLGRYQDAESYLLKAMDHGVKEAYYYVPLNYEAREEYTKAEEFYLNYLGKFDDDAAMYNQYGAYLMHRGRYQAAITQIEQGLSLEDLGEAEQVLYYNQAVCYEYLMEYAKACELFREYVKKYPEDRIAQRELEFLESR